MHGEMTMSMPLLPAWLRVVWVLALSTAVVAHAGHAWAMPGQRRWWHVGHTVMAVGMALMYALPRMHHPVLYQAGLVLFVLLAIAEIAATVVFRHREGVVNPLWALAAVDMLAMAYMLLPMAFRPGWLTFVFVVYLAGQVVAWAFGAWDRLPVFRPSGTTSEASARGRAAAGRSDGPALLATDPVPEYDAGSVVGLTTHSTVAVRVTLAIMAAGMAYMLAVM